MYFLIAILLIVILVFGIAASMQSYATAQQAQAQIEVAKAAQVNAWGNLIVILVLALVILAALAMILWVLYRWSTVRHQQYMARLRQASPHSIAAPGGQQLSPIDQLVELEKLRILRDLRGDISPALPASVQREQEVMPADDPFYWLR